MKLLVNNKERELELLSKEGNSIQVSVDGKQYEMDVVMTENGFCSIICNGHSYNAESVRHANDKYTITTNFRNFDIEILNQQKQFIKKSRNPSDSNTQENMVSLMPGKIMKVFTSAGDAVKQGDALFIVEAMKMQNTYTAERDGEIAEVLVTEGDAVNKDQIILSFKSLN